MSFSLETLEFDSLLSLVARNAQTQMGAERIAELRPVASRITLDKALAEISETIVLNEEKQVTWSFSGLEDPTDSVAAIRIANTRLDPIELLEVARVCTQALLARAAIQVEKDTVPTLWQIVEQIPLTLSDAVGEITRKLLPGGEVSDDASPELAKLRREINAQRARLTKSLESAMRKAGTAIQDEIVTLRNDRYVIPVKTDFKGKVVGVAHGFSSSGATVYVEPLDAIEANNELQNLKGKEEREVARILFSLTEKLREQLPAVEAAVDAVAQLDAIKAKVEFARKFRCVVPEITDDTLELVDARHPLLEENLRRASTQSVLSADDADNADKEDYKKVILKKSASSALSAVKGAEQNSTIVPSTFGLTNDSSIMIISGANAGGKTVVLKTAGLLSLMAISGLPVPAREARIPFYRSVLADIGDHQSLSANLSTFSSHMSNIASMIEECQPPSLVLLDEAGTGTDPEEGSALGVAIVDHFRSQGAHVIASTHYRGLKMYAANDENIINASVEFDEKTLQPTYKLLIGLAGASSGIEIARRFGIAQNVIDVARENLDLSAQEAEDYLKRLQTETKIATDLRIALEEEREAVALKYGSLEVEAVAKEKKRQKEFEQALARAVNDFDRQSTAFLQTIEDKALRNKLDKERLARKAELNRAIVSKVQSPKSKVGAAMSEPGAIATGFSNGEQPELAVGAKVVTSFGNIGTVEKMDNEVAEVLVGNLRLREKITDLQIAESQDQSPKPKARITQSISDLDGETTDISTELNLIGRTTADAEYELDRFIDEAYMSRTPRVRIIHGFGTGALKNYVHHFLKTSDLIAKFEFAPSSQGGHGATIAELKL
ncbi:MAG: Smr/MutS family protein [Blastocatellia bacterium]|nr:Smr/MutS family protein [Blastocatellia bacterium]